MAKDISVVIPAYNEEKIIERTTLDLLEYLNSIKKKGIIHTFEIIIGVNGSTDDTEKIARQLSRKHNEIRYVSTPIKGMGAGLTEGVKAASKEYVTFVAADGEILPTFIPSALKLSDRFPEDVQRCPKLLP